LRIRRTRARNDLGEVRAAQSELEQSLPELSPVFGAADPDTDHLKDAIHRGSEGASLARREFLAEPAQNRVVSVLVLVELDLVPGHGGASQHEALSRAIAP